MKVQPQLQWRPQNEGVMERAESRHHVAGSESLRRCQEPIGEGAAVETPADWRGQCSRTAAKNNSSYGVESV